MYICYCPLRDPNWNKNIVLYCIVLYAQKGRNAAYDKVPKFTFVFPSPIIDNPLVTRTKHMSMSGVINAKFATFSKITRHIGKRWSSKCHVEHVRIFMHSARYDKYPSVQKREVREVIF